jgi:Helicase HerA, central domain
MDPLFAPIFDILTTFALLGGGVLLIVGGVAVAPRVLGLLRQRAYDRAVGGERLRWLLRLDAASARDPDAGRRLVGALHPGVRRGVSRWASGWPSLTLALRWVEGRARWEIEAPRQLSRAVEAAIAAAYPGAELELIERAEDNSSGVRLGVRGEPPETPVRAPADFGAIMVELLSRLPPGATAAWQIRVWPQPDDQATASADRPGWGEMLLDSALNRPSRPLPPARPATSSQRPIGPVFSAAASLVASGSAAASLRAWLFDAIGAVGALRASGWRIEASVGGRSAAMRVGPHELAELWGLSGAASEERAVDVVRSRRLPAPPVAPAPGLRPIGVDGGRPVLVPERLFDRHLLLLGRTGSGKSTELVALAADDLRAGRGFTFIDPHGDAVARLLEAVPEDQAHRVHLLELAEKEHPRGFNPIELDGADPEIVAAQFVDTMRDLYFAHLSAPPHRQLQILRSALMTLLSKKPPRAEGPWTLESLNHLFIDPGFREEVLVGMDDPMLTAFWKHQWSRGGRGAPDPSADALISKLSAFLSYPSIRAIVSAPTSTIRPGRIMDAGEVLLVDLSRAGGDNAWLFGGLVIARYYVDALGRQALPPDRRVPHSLYVDEVQNFDTSALRGVSAEGRKFAVQLVMATQYLESLGRELQRAIRANVATIALLQPSADDARLLRDEMAPLTKHDLLNLPRFRMAIRTELGGDARVLTADVLPEPPRLASAAMVRRLSDARDVRSGWPRNERRGPRQ